MANFCGDCGHALGSTAHVAAASKPKAKAKATRKPSAYSLKYSKAFKAVKSKHMKKSGGWKKDGYKRAVKAAHKKAKAMR